MLGYLDHYWSTEYKLLLDAQSLLEDEWNAS